MIPAPPASTLTIGPLTLHLYGLLMGIGIVTALQIGDRTFPYIGWPREKLISMFIPAIIGGFIGARLYHVASRPQYYADHPTQIPAIWNGGLGVWGGVAGGVGVALIFVKRRGYPMLSSIDAAAPALLFAQAIGRWGNYVNQELFGRPTDAWWALQVDPKYRPDAFAQFDTFHPTFLYESFASLLLGITLLILFFRWKSKRPGMIFALYVAGYCLIRFFVEGLRIDAAHEFFGLRQGQWVALALGGCALAWMVWETVRARKSRELPS